MATATETVSPADDEIRNDVLAQLNWDGRVQPSEIGVAVKDGTVTLDGWVDSDSKRWTAEEAVHRVHRVKAVVNQLEVRLPSSAERTDADIATAIVRALESDALVPVENLEVAVSNGRVTLEGDVEWQYQKEDAERVVHRLAGVRGVSNLIAVRPLPTSSDLKRRIEEALVRSAELDAADRGRGTGEQGRPERDGPLLGGAGRGGAGGLVGAGSHRGRKPDHRLRLSLSALNDAP